MTHAWLKVLSCVAVTAFVPSVSRADLIFSVSLDTSPLGGHPAGPFSIEFQLNDGSGAGDSNNTAFISNFLFGGGSASGSPIVFGGASGSLAAGVTITDSDFFNQFIEEFTPGTTLSFDVQLTTNVDVGGTPDAFSFAILDRTSAETPTLGFANKFLYVDINSPTLTVQAFASDPSRSPFGGGGPIDIATPQVQVQQQQVVPEPATLTLFSIGGAGLLGYGWRRYRPKNIEGQR